MTNKLDDMNIRELGHLFPVIISEPDPHWKACYRSEKKNILRRIGRERIIRISHIGSTAVPDLPAKPVIDILIEITPDTVLDVLTDTFISAGYHFIPKSENPPPHMMFVKGYTEQGYAGQAYHVHIRYKGDWDEIIFRDYLAGHPGTAAEYAALKRNLAARHTHNRETYTGAKSDFIRRVVALARKNNMPSPGVPGPPPDGKAVIRQ